MEESDNGAYLINLHHCLPPNNYKLPNAVFINKKVRDDYFIQFLYT